MINVHNTPSVNSGNSNFDSFDIYNIAMQYTDNTIAPNNLNSSVNTNNTNITTPNTLNNVNTTSNTLNNAINKKSNSVISYNNNDIINSNLMLNEGTINSPGSIPQNINDRANICGFETVGTDNNASDIYKSVHMEEGIIKSKDYASINGGTNGTANMNSVFVLFNKIYDIFISPSSLYCVNLSGKIVKNIKNNMKFLSSHVSLAYESSQSIVEYDEIYDIILDEAYTEVLNDIYFNSYVKYLNSKNNKKRNKK